MAGRSCRCFRKKKTVVCASELTGPAKLENINWNTLYPKLNLNGLCALVASHSALLNYQDNHWHFALSQEHSALYDKNQETLLADAVSAYFQTAIRVSIEIVPQSIATPEKARQQQANDALAVASQSLQENQHFRQILAQFHATIVPDSIVSLKHKNSTNEV